MGKRQRDAGAAIPQGILNMSANRVARTMAPLEKGTCGGLVKVRRRGLLESSFLLMMGSQETMSVLLSDLRTRDTKLNLLHIGLRSRFFALYAFVGYYDPG
jgi:hypothetical protein